MTIPPKTQKDLTVINVETPTPTGPIDDDYKVI
jgi:hypothetical protein